VIDEKAASERSKATLGKQSGNSIVPPMFITAHQAHANDSIHHNWNDEGSCPSTTTILIFILHPTLNKNHLMKYYCTRADGTTKIKSSFSNPSTTLVEVIRNRQDNAGLIGNAFDSSTI
jgi:hypothetical protein